MWGRTGEIMSKKDVAPVAPVIKAPPPAPPAAPAEPKKPPEEAAQGIVCPNRACRSRRNSVLRTVPKGNIVVRYRCCQACGSNFVTEEKSLFSN